MLQIFSFTTFNYSPHVPKLKPGRLTYHYLKKIKIIKNLINKLVVSFPGFVWKPNSRNTASPPPPTATSIPSHLGPKPFTTFTGSPKAMEDGMHVISINSSHAAQWQPMTLPRKKQH